MNRPTYRDYRGYGHGRLNSFILVTPFWVFIIYVIIAAITFMTMVSAWM